MSIRIPSAACFQCGGKETYILKSKKFHCLWISVLLFLCCIGHTACGEKEQQREFGIDGYIYRGEWIPFSGDGAAHTMRVFGDSLYYMQVREGGTTLYEMPLENGIDMEGIREFIPNCSGENEYVVDYEMAENGEYYCRMRKKSSSSCALVKYDEDGREIYRLELPEVNDDLNFDLRLAVDGEGYVFLLSEGAIWWVNPEGKLGGSIATGAYCQGGMDQRLRKGEEDKVYYCIGNGIDKYAIYELVGKEPFRLEKRADFPEGERCVGFFSSEYGLLCDGSNALYQYREDGWRKVLDWGDSDIFHPGSGFYELAQIDEENFALIGSPDGNYDVEALCCLKRTAVSGLPEKEELVLATTYRNDRLFLAVADFNRTSDKYRVRIEAYESSEIDTGLNPRLVSSDPPDLLEMTSLDILNYAQKAAFEDLAPYLEGSVMLDRDMFPENLLEGYTIDGKLVCIPRAFEIQALAGSASRLGAGMGWTMEEVMELTERYPDQKLALDTSAQFLVKELGGRYICQRYIDWETGECRFDSDGFCAFLEWVGENADRVRPDYSLRLKGYWDTERLLEKVDLYSLGVCAEIETIFGGDATFIGDPTEDGKAVFSVRPMQALCIPTNSGHREGAWAFVEYLLSHQDMLLFGFASRKDFLERGIEEEMTPEYFLTEEGEVVMNKGEPILKVKYIYNEVPYYYMTHEQETTVRQILEAADFAPWGGARETVTEIILEEIGAFMDGTRSVRDTARIIQNRVRMLVQERML